MNEGLDVVIEGRALPVNDAPRLQHVADGFASTYVDRDGAKVWRFAVQDGAFNVDGAQCLLHEVTPRTIFGFGKGTFSQTGWRF